MRLKAEVLDRINVQNNPVNWIDPLGLEYSSYNTTSEDIDYGGGSGGFSPPSSQHYNANHNQLKHMKPDNVTMSGMLVTTEYESHLYSSSEGWLPCPNSDINFTTGLLGGGTDLLWDTSIPTWGPDIELQIGLLKYLGLLYNPKTGQIGFSLGVSASIPVVNVTVPLGPQEMGPIF